jgi:transcriptional regulator with XRE-family HTH domain
MEISRLREWRERRGYTQRGLASESGVSERSIAGYEAGHSTRPNTAHKLALVLEIAPEDMMDFEGEHEMGQRGRNRPKEGPPPRKSTVERARENLSRAGGEMNSEEVDEYLREHNASLTAMPLDDFEALEDLPLPEFRRHRHALEVEKSSLEDAMDGTRISALAVLRAAARSVSWRIHPEERRRWERAEELAHA